MRVAIVGAGSIGGFIGTRLGANARCEVSVLARGATLTALRAHGFRLHEGGAIVTAAVHASDRAEDLGPQDLVVVAVKGQSLAAVAPAVQTLLGPQTVVLPAMNGVPWWFGHGVAALGNEPLASVDPGGRIAAAIPFGHVVGCVVHASTASPEPGVVRHAMGRGLIIGEPLGGGSARVERIGALLGEAGFEVTRSTDVRYDIWYKLWGNLTMNPVSAVTGATIDRILDDPLVLAFCSAAMREAAAIGRQIGCDIAQSPEDRHAITRRLGAFKSSMLQDVEAGRTIELDAIVAAVSELGRRVAVATPNVDALLGITRLFGRVRGLYPEAAAGR